MKNLLAISAMMAATGAAHAAAPSTEKASKDAAFVVVVGVECARLRGDGSIVDQATDAARSLLLRAGVGSDEAAERVKVYREKATASAGSDADLDAVVCTLWDRFRANSASP